MKKWFKFFCLSFFSDKRSKEGARRGYTNVFLSLILALIFIWSALVGGEMLPFSLRYGNSPDFAATVRGILANADTDKRICVEIQDGVLRAKKQGGEYTDGVLVNTFEDHADRQDYSSNGYNVVVDTRPADALAEVTVCCVSNNGQGLTITYEEYLVLNAATRLTFDFKLDYTGRELVLTDEAVANYRTYLESLSDESKLEAEKIANEFADGKITKTQYNREIYKLYFTNYYPEITSYESSSSVPLLRNYYYHKYISSGESNYLIIFDDYMTGSFETKSGKKVSFYGFYTDFENGALIGDGADQSEANALADAFVKRSYRSILPLTLYAHAMNVISLIPFIALMPMVVTLLAYSLLRLMGVESVSSLGGMFKIVGSYLWFSGVISAALSLIISFFVRPGILTAIPLVLLFIALAVRSVIFAVNENRAYKKQLEQQQAEQTEV